MNNKPTSLSDSIKTDHNYILSTLDAFDAANISEQEFMQLKACLHHLSACQLAEELTLYEQAGRESVDTNAFRSFHAMLDDLCDTMQHGGRHNDALPFELGVLRALVEYHFNEEESLLLKPTERVLNSQQSSKLAEDYARCVRQNAQ